METPPHFTWQFIKERRKIDLKQSQKNFESSAVFHNFPHPHTLNTPQGGETDTTTDSSFISEMEYDAALKEKANTQAERIIELEASMDDQNVLIDTTDCAERAVATSTNNKMDKIKAMMK